MVVAADLYDLDCDFADADDDLSANANVNVIEMNLVVLECTIDYYLNCDGAGAALARVLSPMG